jgi:hypothetical protein
MSCWSGGFGQTRLRGDDDDMTIDTGAEHFSHGADVGVRGIGRNKDQAFEQAALALSQIVTDVERVIPREAIAIECMAPSDGLLPADWLNRLIGGRTSIARSAPSLQPVMALDGR